jgi:hypothetical protein
MWYLPRVALAAVCRKWRDDSELRAMGMQERRHSIVLGIY